MATQWGNSTANKQVSYEVQDMCMSSHFLINNDIAMLAIARSDSSSFDPYKPMIGGQTFDERNKQRYQSSHSQQVQMDLLLYI